MPTRQEILEIIASYMNTATPEQAEELKTLLKQRAGSGGLGNLDFAAMAEKVAASIREQMGLSKEALRETAVNAVSRLIRSSVPEISDHDLSLLLEEMIPSMVESRRSPIPPDMLEVMVNQFAAYSLGRMPSQAKTEMPQGWTAKYWNAFPPVIKGLISKLLYGEIDEELFNLAVKEAIRRIAEENGGAPD
jgi:hypothetical protein